MQDATDEVEKKGGRDIADVSLKDPVARISAKDFEDYEFIAREIKRLATLPPEAQIEHFRADPWASSFTLKGANRSEFSLSRAAQERFVQIAKRGLKALGPTAADHRIERVLQKLKRGVIRLRSQRIRPDR
jgi:hypothetical protein